MTWHGRSSFRLAKWYGDCVADDGTAFIGYAGTLRVGPVTLPYQAALLAEPGQPLRQRSALTRHDPPALGPGRVSWSPAALGVSASWEGDVAPIRAVLLERADLRIEWRCHLPRARAAVRTGARPELRGTGYVEEIVMVGDPRHIPIRELRWGRFHGEDHWAVWIDWRGEHPLLRAWADGVEVQGARVSDHGVELAAPGPIAFLAPRDVRHGDVAETVFPGKPWLQRLIPASLRHMDEHKWVARATLHAPPAPSDGWALFETVTWP